MLKGNTIYLRMLEPEDWELTFNWHNDPDIQRLTCGPIRVVSKEIEKAWVNSKATNNRNELYLAICLNSDQRMIGYTSLGKIDNINQSCFWSGVVIGDKKNQDGIALAESTALLLDYVYTQMNMNRVTGTCLSQHLFSNAMLKGLFFQQEGLERSSIYKNGKFNDICLYSLLKDEYLLHKENGDYMSSALLRNILVSYKQVRKKSSTIK
jgi:hypothetical protein